MKITLLSIFLLFSTNPKDKQDSKHVGTFEVYMNSEDEVEVRYTGKYNKCFTLYLIKRVETECADKQIDQYLDSIYQFDPILIDTCPKPIIPIKTIRM